MMPMSAEHLESQPRAHSLRLNCSPSQVVLQNMDDPLDDIGMVQQQLDQFSVICRCKYDKTCQLLVQIFDTTISTCQAGELVVCRIYVLQNQRRITSLESPMVFDESAYRTSQLRLQVLKTKLSQKRSWPGWCTSLVPLLVVGFRSVPPRSKTRWTDRWFVESSN